MLKDIVKNNQYRVNIDDLPNGICFMRISKNRTLLNKKNESHTQLIIIFNLSLLMKSIPNVQFVHPKITHKESDLDGINIWWKLIYIHDIRLVKTW